MNTYLDILFTNDAAVIEANKAEAARIETVEAASKAADIARTAAIEAEKVANRCPKCFGTGYIPHFMHRKNGECFTCNGSGIFRKYAA